MKSLTSASRSEVPRWDAGFHGLNALASPVSRAQNPRVTNDEAVEILEAHGLRASAQRVAVARHVLPATNHPTANAVWKKVTRHFPQISRATIYNTLAAFVEAGLLHKLSLDEGDAVYDPCTEPHHHFIDDRTGRITDIPWDALRVEGLEGLEGLEGIDVRDFQVVVRGRTGRTS